MICYHAVSEYVMKIIQCLRLVRDERPCQCKAKIHRALSNVLDKEYLTIVPKPEWSDLLIERIADGVGVSMLPIDNNQHWAVSCYHYDQIGPRYLHSVYVAPALLRTPQHLMYIHTLYSVLRMYVRHGRKQAHG